MLPVGVSEQLLIAVPRGAWHRQTRNRRLPAGLSQRLLQSKLLPWPTRGLKLTLFARPNAPTRRCRPCNSCTWATWGYSWPASTCSTVGSRTHALHFPFGRIRGPEGTLCCSPDPELADRVSRIESCLSDLQVGMTQLLQNASGPSTGPLPGAATTNPSAREPWTFARRLAAKLSRPRSQRGPSHREA